MRLKVYIELFICSLFIYLFISLLQFYFIIYYNFNKKSYLFTNALDIHRQAKTKESRVQCSDVSATWWNFASRCLHKFSELWNSFSPVPYGKLFLLLFQVIVFQVIVYVFTLELFTYQIFVH